MNADEVGNLLGLMALADNRKPPLDEEGQNAMITFWLGMVGDLTYPDAANAVRDHYRESRAWCMPADIRERVNAMRFTRLRENPPPPPRLELLDDPEAYRQWVVEHGSAIANAEPLPRQIEGAP